MAYDFDKIASSYDRLNHIMTAGMDRLWRRRAAKEALKTARRKTASATNALTLDVACGTGDMAIELLKRGSSVTGIDLSEEMLAIARRKTAEANFQLSTFNSPMPRLCHSTTLRSMLSLRLLAFATSSTWIRDWPKWHVY